MVDALAPAAAAAAGESLAAALAAAAAAAEQGVEQTKTMVATVGKAKTLGERALGHADPGAMSMSLLLRFMNDYLAPH